MITATTCKFKTSVVIEVVFHDVVIVEVIANNVAVLLYGNVAADNITVFFSLFGCCHAESELTDTHQ